MFGSLAPARRRFVLAIAAVLAVAVVATVIIVLLNRHGGSSASAIGPTASPGRSAASGQPAASGAPSDPNSSGPNSPGPSHQNDEPGPVLLVPGYGGSTTALTVLAERLRTAGRDADVVSLPDGGTGDLNVQAKTLRDAATAALKRTGATSVDIVGYSAGGVVARLWVRNYGGAAEARRIVTLGSPQHGTQVADLGAALLPSECPLACQQLSTTSTLLAALNTPDETPAGPSFVSVWTTADTVVVPPESARLTGAAVNLTVQQICASSTVTHTDLPRDPLVGAIVLAELAKGTPPILTAADCSPLSS